MAKGKKTGGRQKGTPNEVTKELRAKVSAFLSDNWSLIESDFKQLQPKERLMFYEKLMSYGLPKLQTINAPDLDNSGQPIGLRSLVIVPASTAITDVYQ